MPDHPTPHRDRLLANANGTRERRRAIAKAKADLAMERTRAASAKAALDESGCVAESIAHLRALVAEGSVTVQELTVGEDGVGIKQARKIVAARRRTAASAAKVLLHHFREVLKPPAGSTVNVDARKQTVQNVQVVPDKWLRDPDLREHALALTEGVIEGKGEEPED